HLDPGLFHRLAIDKQLIVEHLNVVIGEPHHPLDKIAVVIGGEKHHDIPPLGLVHFENFGLGHGQTQAVSVFVDENEITDLQGGHHGCRGNLKGLHHEGAQHQHQQQHGKKRRGVLDIKRRGSVPPPSRQHQLVQQPHDTADQRQHHQYQWKIQIHISCPSSAPPGRLPGEFLRCPPASCAF